MPLTTLLKHEKARRVLMQLVVWTYNALFTTHNFEAIALGQKRYMCVSGFSSEKN